jgi:hypothetical protein
MSDVPSAHPVDLGVTEELRSQRRPARTSQVVVLWQGLKSTVPDRANLNQKGTGNMLQHRRSFERNAGIALVLGIALTLGASLVLSGCDLGESPDGGGDPVVSADPDPQLIKIQHRYSFRDMVDTFHGTLTKDLVLDGTVSIPFWLTRAEQETVRVALERENFFGLPDTLFPVPDMHVELDPSPDILRVEADGVDKTVVWIYPLDQANQNNQAILRVAAVIRRIVEARNEYKQLPEPRGYYL